VTLRVQYFRSQRIYVGGEVRQPGLQPINDLPMTLVEALNRAGGVLPTGDQSHLTVTRAGQRFRIDLPALIAAGQDPARLILRHGDVLHVAAADENKVFVAGEVVTPRALVMHNGRLTLSEALGEVGGVNPVTADASQVYVVRRAGQTPELYRLDAAAPGALAVAEGFELQPRDVVFVAPSGLANWHRALSQLIPGALPAAVSATKQ
jgi:polysaccharide export outer membrane protein